MHYSGEKCISVPTFYVYNTVEFNKSLYVNGTSSECNRLTGITTTVIGHI